VLPDRFRGPVVRVIGGLLAVATAAFVTLELIRRWDDLSAILRDADLAWVLASLAVFVVAEVAFALAWPATLRRLGHAVDTRTAAATFLVTQTAKFVPGAIWPVVGRVGTADRLGVPKREVTAAVALETGMIVAAALLVTGLGGAASPILFDDVGPGLRALEIVAAGAAAGAVGVGARHGAERIAGRPLLRGRPFAEMLLWQVAVWTGYGLATGLLSVGLDGPFTAAIGAFSLAWVAGFVVIGAPAGLGVREAVLTAALTPTAGATTALAVAVGSRAAWTLVQLVMAGVALPAAGAPRPIEVPADDASLPC